MRLTRFTTCLCIAAILPVAVHAQVVTTNQLPSDVARRLDSTVRAVIHRTTLPSASIGIVKDGRIEYLGAYGLARLAPARPATPAMHYAIGSISKQFTAACVLLLAEEGKLTLDDPVSKYFPELTRSNEVTIRNLLSHTSGYEDYAPQDYTIPEWTHPTTAQAVIHQWATKPLDFDPGTQYQYSNTNFNIVGLIVEKVSGQPFWQFLSTRVLQPLQLTHTIDLDTQHDQLEPVGYFRNGFGPLRPALMEAPGWYFADGEMAMPPEDLLKWDLSVINQSLLKPPSYKEMETETRLKSGRGAGYGLGVSVGARNGHRVVSHSGEVGGFVAYNLIFPDDKIAVVVLTNQEASSGAGEIARAIADLLIAPAPVPATAVAESLVTRVLNDLARGEINRSLFTANANFYFDKTAIDDYHHSLRELGPVTAVRQTGTSLRGGMTYRGFQVSFAKGTTATVSTFTTSDGKLEQFLLEP